MSLPEYNQTDRLVASDKGYRLERVSEDGYLLTRATVYTRFRYWNRTIGSFVILCVMAVTFLLDPSNAGLARPVGMMLCAVAVAFVALLVLVRDSWFVTRGRIEKRTAICGLTFRRHVTDRQIELQRDSKIGRCLLHASSLAKSRDPFDYMTFDVSTEYQELARLGRLLANLTGWPFYEYEMDLSEPSSGVGGG